MSMKNSVIRAKEIFREEGLISLMKLIIHHSFRYRNLYLYEHILEEREEIDFLPKIQNFTVKIVSSNQEADLLASEGSDFRDYMMNARRSLDKGAIAFCIFVDAEFAHVGWLAMTEEAKNTFDPLPYRVDFSNKEACCGGTLTIPKYRGKGFMTYGYFLRFQFLLERGIKIARNAVEINNIASLKAHAKFDPKIYAKARYFKILWWKIWKEIPRD